MSSVERIDLGVARRIRHFFCKKRLHMGCGKVGNSEAVFTFPQPGYQVIKVFTDLRRSPDQFTENTLQ